jgi:hypothetical protein
VETRRPTAGCAGNGGRVGDVYRFRMRLHDSAHFGRIFSAPKRMAPSRWRKQAREQ